MRATELGELSAFVAIADAGSFRRAAARLNLKPSTLSRTLRMLEDRLGVQLLLRSTRRLSLTEAGQALLMDVRPALERIDDAVERLNQYREVPAGSIRLSVPHTAALHVLLPRLREFSERYPDISLEISADNGFVDIIQDGFDAGIRLRSDVPRDMVAVPITPPVHVAVVASPDYLEQHGTPMTPADLQHHLCINRRLIQGDGLQRWEFMQEGRMLRVSVPGKLVLNDAGLILAAALDGQGLAYSADQLVADHLTAGRLVRVLADFSPRIEGFCLYYPNRRISVTLRALVEMLKDARVPAAH